MVSVPQVHRSNMLRTKTSVSSSKGEAIPEDIVETPTRDRDRAQAGGVGGRARGAALARGRAREGSRSFDATISCIDLLRTHRSYSATSARDSAPPPKGQGRVQSGKYGMTSGRGATTLQSRGRGSTHAAGMVDFDIILGMDWLSSHHVILDCYANTVTLAMLGVPSVEWTGASGSYYSKGFVVTPQNLVDSTRAKCEGNKPRKRVRAKGDGQDCPTFPMHCPPPSYESLHGSWWSPRLMGPLVMILRRIRKVSYELELPNKLASVHPVFHVSMLKKCVGDPTTIVPLEGLGVNENLSYEEVLIEIPDRQDKNLKSKEATPVKVLWMNVLVEGATWEAEAVKMSRYPLLCPSTPPLSV
ncbi:hypothetical protein MTR67_007796 [Solanum verrucosum]|uniref:Tf2-1-like SH3-like domain-containing protein n=1 Tax=Solanum verrucosum TaxID=315347 RepID=A0AAF0Q5P8_SOLVR|nr:hypothetical protein MTR67_007796 [Solanum verrucosum]